MNTEQIETEKQEFMDYILELKNKKILSNDDTAINLIKQAIVTQTKNGHSAYTIYKCLEVTLSGVYIYILKNKIYG